jgi:diguanylate cyclase (GGDEF)-like protein
MSITGYIGMIASIILTANLITPYIEIHIVYYWVLFILIGYTPRIIITLLFKRAQSKGQITLDSVSIWEKRVLIHSFLPFISFCSLCLLPYHQNVFTAVVISAFILISLLVGCVLLYGGSLKIANLYFHISLIFLLSRCLYEATFQFYILASYLFILYLITRKLLANQYQNFISNIIQRIQYENMSLSDSLTGLPNRRRLELFVKDLIPLSKRSSQEFQVAMIDIDNFKQYNDSFGHIKGDELLISLAKLISRYVRSGDLFCRFGGEEFVYVFSIDTRQSAIKDLSELMIDIKNNLGITVSIGLASSHLSEEFSELVELADRALYQSKSEGKNRITFAK